MTAEPSTSSEHGERVAALRSARPFRSLQPVIAPHLGAVRLAGGLAIAESLVALLEPWPLKVALDYGIDSRPVPGWLSPLSSLSPRGVVVVAGLASVLLVAVNRSIGYQVTLRAQTTAERIGRDLRTDLFEHLSRAPLRFHDEHRSGELSSRVTTDVNRVLDALIAWFTRLAPQVVLLVGMTVVLLAIDVPLAFIALAGAAPLWLIAIRRRRAVREAEGAARVANGAFSATTADLLRNIRTVQAFGRDGYVDNVFTGRNVRTTDANINSYRVQARWSPVTDLMLALGEAVVLVAAAFRVIDGRLSIGTMLVVLSYVGMMYGPVRSLSGLAATLAKASVSAGRLDEILAQGASERVAEPVEVPPFVEGFTFEHVTFSYSADRTAVADLTFSVEPGETVALVGPSGAGKSTVCSLALRLYEPDLGRITIDGIDIAAIGSEDARRLVGYVPQGAWLLDGTIADNIALGHPELSRADILAAGRACLVDDFAHCLPDGYDSDVGENGAQLSGGERQRIALARAIVTGAPLLLLDEPTTGLDYRSRGRVIEAIDRAAAGRAVLVVTHDLDLARRADRIIEIEAGMIVKDRKGGVQHEGSQEHTYAYTQPQQEPQPQPHA